MNMKKISNTIKQIGLVLTLLLALSNANIVNAQTEEEYEEDEESFFNDGINGSRFESDLNKDYQSITPDYQYQKNKIKSSDNDFDNQGSNDIFKELNVEDPNEINDNSYIIGGGGGSPSGAKSSNNQVPGMGQVLNQSGVNQQLKDGGGPGSYIPDNNGDPDAPIDGGIGLIIAAGIGIGLKKKLNKQ